MELEARLDTVVTVADLADLVAALADDLARNPEAWENPTLPRFLDALSVWLRDQEHSHVARGEPPLDPPTWRSLGAALLAARIYE
jgi:hypothetical protein